MRFEDRTCFRANVRFVGFLSRSVKRSNQSNLGFKSQTYFSRNVTEGMDVQDAVPCVLYLQSTKDGKDSSSTPLRHKRSAGSE